MEQLSRENLEKETVEIAGRISHRWKEIPKGEAGNIWQADYPDFAHVFDMTQQSGGKTGVQVYYENEIKRIREQTSGNEGLGVDELLELKGKLERFETAVGEIITEYK